MNFLQFSGSWLSINRKPSIIMCLQGLRAIQGIGIVLLGNYYFQASATPIAADTLPVPQEAKQVNRVATGASVWPSEPNQVINEEVATASWPYIPPEFREFADDPVVQGKISQKLNGVLLYAPMVSDPPYETGRVFTLRHIGEVTTGVDPRGTIANYGGADGDGDIFDPIFAPTGRAISYKSGRRDSHGFYRIYVWDFDQKTVVKVTDELVYYPFYKWAPLANALAYVQGGDSDKANEEDNNAQLMVTRVRSAKATPVASHPVLQLEGAPIYESLSMFSWSSDETLLFAQHEREPASKTIGAGRGKGALNSTSSIYECLLSKNNLDEGRVQKAIAKKILENGYAPLASPDNQWIAFMRPSSSAGKASLNLDKVEDSRKVQPDSTFPHVCLFNRKTKAIFNTGVSFNNPNSRLADVALRWTPDSQHLVISQSYTSRPTSKSLFQKGQLRICLVGIASIAKAAATSVTPSDAVVTDVVILPPWSVEGILRTTFFPIQVRQVTKDGRYLLLSRRSPSNDPNTGESLLNQSFLALNLSSGKVESVVQFAPAPEAPPTCRGWDWLDDPINKNP